MKLITPFRKKFLLGESYFTQDVNDLKGKEYDLAMFFPSWDTRCTVLTAIEDIKFKSSIFVQFKKVDKYGLRKKHDSLILEFLNKNSDETFHVSGHSTEIETISSKIIEYIESVYESINKPLKILLDLSTCPRYYAINILAFLIKSGMLYNITFTYSEAKYPDTEKKEYIEFTKGRWKSIEVPYIFSECSPTKRKHLIVSVGFEGNKTLQMVDKEDPDRISILFPLPGYVNGYEEITFKENEQLIKSFKVPEDQIINVHAGDAIKAWKTLDSRSLERYDVENSYYLCCGTKPHSIALALRAITLEYPSVRYRLPDSHTFTNIIPNGNLWVYKIRDLSSF